MSEISRAARLHRKHLEQVYATWHGCLSIGSPKGHLCDDCSRMVDAYVADFRAHLAATR